MRIHLYARARMATCRDFPLHGAARRKLSPMASTEWKSPPIRERFVVETWDMPSANAPTPSFRCLREPAQFHSTSTILPRCGNVLAVFPPPQSAVAPRLCPPPEGSQRSQNLDGFAPATVLGNTGAPARCGPSDENGPAGTGTAEATAVSGMVRVLRLSHDRACTSAQQAASAAAAHIEERTSSALFKQRRREFA